MRALRAHERRQRQIARPRGARMCSLPTRSCAVERRKIHWLANASLLAIAVKCRASWLIAASALAPLSLGVSQPALAQCAGPADNTICTPGGNPYPGGINVNTQNGLGGAPVNLTLQPGVQVIIPPG